MKTTTPESKKTLVAIGKISLSTTHLTGCTNSRRAVQHRRTDQVRKRFREKDSLYHASFSDHEYDHTSL